MEEILNEILANVKETREEVKKISEKVNTLEKEFYKFKEEMYEFREEFYKFKEEMYEFREEFYKFKEEMYEFREEFYKFKEEMYVFKEETYYLFDKYSKETAMEINELIKVISKKALEKYEEFTERIEKIRNSEKQLENSNKREHKVYEAQINKIEATQDYLESKIESMVS